MIQILEGTVFIENKEFFLKKIKEISTGKNLAIQAFDADKLAGKEHLTYAIEKALNSFKKAQMLLMTLRRRSCFMRQALAR